ncbi:cadherin-like beta sandwich domain-containing protein [Belliella baltica]|uniref:cadherin-like beta sandwich domain-containing protein n=1 Tax=Belliella baltica TaxID=232259 RepID=UPI0002E37B10|nr:cadherin-like beta sandwich domain-containing protein [Belliella baltica]
MSQKIYKRNYLIIVVLFLFFSNTQTGYSVEINNLNDLNQLTNISSNKGTLNPSFDPDIYQYNVQVSFLDSEIILRAETDNASLLIQVNGNNPRASFNETRVPLVFGTTSIPINLIKDGQIVNQYFVDVIRPIPTTEEIDDWRTLIKDLSILAISSLIKSLA